jgi:hypothetical protein
MTIAEDLKNQAEMREEFTVNHFEEFEDYDKCCLHAMDCCTLLWPHSILKATKQGTRIYVFVGNRNMLVRFMRQMTTEKLFDEGRYMVIYLYPESVKLDERMFFLWTKEDLADTKKLGSSCEDMEAYHERLRAWKSLIVVSGSPYRIDTNTNTFADQVIKPFLKLSRQTINLISGSTLQHSTPFQLPCDPAEENSRHPRLNLRRSSL